MRCASLKILLLLLCSRQAVVTCLLSPYSSRLSPSRRVRFTLKASREAANEEKRGLAKLCSTTSSPSSPIECSRSAFLASLVAIPAAAVSVGGAAEAAATTTSSSSPVSNAPMMMATALATTTTAQQESISGFVAGAALAATKTVVKYPLDTATVRLQMPDSTYSIRNLPELFRGSYRGVVSPLLANIPAGAVFFAVKDAAKASLSEQTSIRSNRWLTTALAVGVAQFPYWAVRNPSEVVKTRQQAGLAGYGDEGVRAWEAYWRVRESRIQQQQQQQQQLKQQSSLNDDSNNSTTAAPALNPLVGLDAFYTGYLENILYAYPADVIKFVVYEQLTGGRKNLPPAQGAMAGAAATAIAQLLTTPLDVVRNRIMAETTTNSGSTDNGGKATTTTQRLSYTESLLQLAREEGLAGLFAGTTPRVGKAIVSGAIQFATYEETKLEIAKLFQPQQSNQQ